MESTPQKPIGRFAPSPSGRMHLGNIFCALLCWLSIRSGRGELILRIEDLDIHRCTRQNADMLMEDLQWLGLDWDYGPGMAQDFAPYYQSERYEHYKKAVEKLSDMGKVYPCYCSRAEIQAASAPHLSDGNVVYGGQCRELTLGQQAEKAKLKTPALRMHMPDITVDFTDRVYGHMAENLACECGDIILRRADGVYAYQLAVVADDIAMGVTEVVRGRDLLSSVARQQYLCRQLGAKPPSYAHVPLLIAPDGRRLSKREADLDMGELRHRHPDPQVIVGRLAYMCGIIPEDKPMTPTQLLQFFDWDKLRIYDIMTTGRPL